MAETMIVTPDQIEMRPGTRGNIKGLTVMHVNEGGARAADVAALIDRARSEVMRRFGVELEREVELVGKWN